MAQLPITDIDHIQCEIPAYSVNIPILRASELTEYDSINFGDQVQHEIPAYSAYKRRSWNGEVIVPAVKTFTEKFAIFPVTSVRL